MEMFEYIFNGLGTYLGFNSVFLGLVLLLMVIILALRYGVQGFALLSVFLVTVISFGVTTFNLGFFFTSLFIPLVIGLALILAFVYFTFFKN